ncbi:MAG: hypothetical protein GKR87_05705 [Kiritimatiellae bacterium]|nr:hypothetical protein [Kiritimatiellia bacterium]
MPPKLSGTYAYDGNNNIIQIDDALGNIENVTLSEEAEQLANNYVEEEVVRVKHMADAQHIAIATVERVDVLVSWNFRHIVNLGRIHAFNSVNLRLGYPILEIRIPKEILDEKEI